MSVWNKGLTKETHPGLLKISKALTGIPLTNERIKKISEVKKGCLSWNTGLTKYTDSRVARQGRDQKYKSAFKRTRAKRIPGSRITPGSRIIRRDYHGKNNPNWKGGTSNSPYPLEFNGDLKEKIRIRDGRVCQRCGVLESECRTKLHIHHIDYNKENSRLFNLISLCERCNAQVNRLREYWVEVFTGKVGANNYAEGG